MPYKTEELHPSIFLGTHGWGEHRYSADTVLFGMLDEKHAGPPYLQSGYLDLRRITRTHSPSSKVILTYNVVGTPFGYEGKFVVVDKLSLPSTLSGLALNCVGPSYFAAYGPVAYNRFKPGNPTASAGQALAEAHQVPGMIRNLPRLLFGRLRRLADLGSRYLETVFGWIPLLNDIREMHATQRHLERSLTQLARDNGKGIRRGGTVFATTDTSEVVETSNAYLYPFLTTPFYWPSGARTPKRTTVTTVEEKVWFAARFRYWIPDIGTSQWRRRATRALYGLNPTPQLLYDVLPWTWLLDWFTNVGDVVANFSENAAEDLVADYACLMGSQRKTIVTSVAGVLRSPSGSQERAVSAKSHVVIESKTRQFASPYGFGVTLSSLSLRQAAVLAALGISRSRF